MCSNNVIKSSLTNIVFENALNPTTDCAHPFEHLWITLIIYCYSAVVHEVMDCLHGEREWVQGIALCHGICLPLKIPQTIIVFQVFHDYGNAIPRRRFYFLSCTFLFMQVNDLMDPFLS